MSAPALVDGMVWRSSVTSDGVYCYMYVLLVDMGGHFADNLAWLRDLHVLKLKLRLVPVLVLWYDLVWNMHVAAHCRPLQVLAVGCRLVLYVRPDHSSACTSRPPLAPSYSLVYLVQLVCSIARCARPFVLDCRGGSAGGFLCRSTCYNGRCLSTYRFCVRSSSCFATSRFSTASGTTRATLRVLDFSQR